MVSKLNLFAGGELAIMRVCVQLKALKLVYQLGHNSMLTGKWFQCTTLVFKPTEIVLAQKTSVPL